MAAAVRVSVKPLSGDQLAPLRRRGGDGGGPPAAAGRGLPRGSVGATARHRQRRQLMPAVAPGSRRVRAPEMPRVGWGRLVAAIVVVALLAAAGGTATAAPKPRQTVLFFGNSLTAGLGLDATEAFPALIAARIDSLGWDFAVVNAGLSGETTAAGLRRVDWLLKRPVDVFVLELGANDGLRGLPLADTKANLLAIVGRVHSRYPQASIVIAGMQLPPNLGVGYTTAFARLFPAVAQQTGAALIPFLLEGVGGVPSLNQGDGIHPTAEGMRLVTNNVWRVLQPVLRSRLGK